MTIRKVTWNHWVFRANTPLLPFNDFETARRTWISLTDAFPQMVAAVLMPNHGHLILPKHTSQEIEDEKRTLLKIYGILGQISKENKGIAYWQTIPAPAFIPDSFHLKRQVRYVALNPCRKKLVRDPLEWYWSTYRELFGATAWGNMTAEKLAQSLGEKQSGFLDRFHAYVSGDPSVSISGTPLPILDSPQIYTYKSIDEILAAASAALRIHPSSVKKSGPLRATFVHLAKQSGWKNHTALLAEICQISPRAVRFILQKPVPSSLSAACVCLSDERLRPLRVTQNFLPQSGKI